MGSIKHDLYPNAPIAEALSEIHFLEDKKLSSSWLSDYQRELISDYPNPQTRHLREFRAQPSQQGMSVEPTGEPIPRVVLKHKNRNQLFQISPNLFTTNELARYPGWDQFQLDLEMGWKNVEKVARPQLIQRIGLRYINRIERTTSSQPLSDWLTESDYFPNSILKTTSRFVSRTEFYPQDNLKLIVTVGEGRNGGSVTPVIFDIDAIYESEIPPKWADIKQRLDVLHDWVWKVFSTPATPLLEKVLKGEKVT